MDCKQYNEKYGPLHAEREKDFWAAIKDWLTNNPGKFVAFQTYVPGFMDGEPCLPSIAYMGAAPGFVDSYYVDSEGGYHYGDDVLEDSYEKDALPKVDREFVDARKDWKSKDFFENQPAEDVALEKVLMNGFSDFIDLWDVTGTIKLVTDRRRKNYGEPVVDTEYYECGY